MREEKVSRLWEIYKILILCFPCPFYYNGLMGFPFSYARFKIQQDFIRYFLGLTLRLSKYGSIGPMSDFFTQSQSVKLLVKRF